MKSIISITSNKNENKRMKKKGPEGKFMATVKVGPKGQIVIPKEVREMFGIESGDSLVLLADVQRGIALNRMSVLGGLVEKIMRADNIETEEGEE